MFVFKVFCNTTGDSERSGRGRIAATATRSPSGCLDISAVEVAILERCERTGELLARKISTVEAYKTAVSSGQVFEYFSGTFPTVVHLCDA
ncbi:hypothetical protein PENSPDRAFT_690450 [Peniophora sp. CONT]|nr:hypothetical protein PENSPDRAFT_690450 [Peniophora sp. CONT]